MREFAVMGETNHGEVMLRRGFVTREQAEEHPVKLSLWKRVWVREIEPREIVDKPPPLPWTVHWIGNRAYVIDADGRKIAGLYGSQARREHTANIIINLTSNGTRG